MSGVLAGHFDTAVWTYVLTLGGLFGYFLLTLWRLRSSGEAV